MAQLRSLRPHVRLFICSPKSKSDSEFGRGVAELCQGVDELGSLNAAAKAMGMAYSKAWRIVHDTEEALGMKLLNRNGARGSTLTKQARALIAAYNTMSESLQDQANDAFRDLIRPS